jgi:hypothetical protein
MWVVLSITGVVAFNWTKCPAAWEIQAPRMSSFELSAFEGKYYELAMHDVTQYPMCPFKPPRCITADKAVSKHADGKVFVNDTFKIQCGKMPFTEQLLFNTTAEKGALRGYVPTAYLPLVPKDMFAKIVFPDTVVDFVPGPRGWALEMQCVEALGSIRFVGINFYSRTVSEDSFQEMLAAAKRSGIDFFFKGGFGLMRVDHSNCDRDQAVADGEDVVLV